VELGPFARLAVLVVLGVVVVAAVLELVDASRDGRLGNEDPASQASEDTTDEGPVEEALAGTVVVSAAASLTEAVAALEVAFEEAFPAVDVVTNVGGSATLAEQVAGGAPVDVLVSANDAVMDRLRDDDLLATVPETLAATSLAIAVPAGNPAGVASVEDLADTSLFLGLCAAGQPCGDYAREALADVGLDGDALADTSEPDVRALLAKVVAGELDAGIVYATDVVAAGADVEGIAIDGPVVTYPVAVVADAPNLRGAEAFAAFATSPEGFAAIAPLGFDPPG
jgi:molybdate transport system substrate-binding protein